MKYIEYDIVSRVLETWTLVRRACKDNDHFERMFGRQIMYQFAQLAPSVQDFYETDEKMGKHAMGIVQLFDSVFQMLGPDLEFIEEILHQVGVRHANMGVDVALFPALGQSLIWAIDQNIGDQMDDEDREAWQLVYDVISADIIKAMNDCRRP
mmetsp:Transcript_6120/g.12269  ORF Transcript_6120/g.12269 Transcript_6120/m.12269 type:complete len:153 (-) Transcript_6120:259-717(-)|eukprot:scaffold5479_cov199-Amphora_coffeaeformis.AAC.53